MNLHEKLKLVYYYYIDQAELIKHRQSIPNLNVMMKVNKNNHLESSY